jgi:hypothetical protein
MSNVKHGCSKYPRSVLSMFVFNRYLGAQIELFSADMLRRRFPWLNVDGIEVGSLGMITEKQRTIHIY